MAGFDEVGRYVLIDSNDDPITGVWDWEDVADWLGEDDAPYEALAILPHVPNLLKRSMVPHIAGIWQTLGNDSELAGRWGDILADLDRVFDFPNERGDRLDAATFFEVNKNSILQPIIWESPQVDETAANNLYADFWNVANFHSLSLPSCYEAHAVSHMVLILQNRLT